MPRERNHESGRYRETITDAEILDFIKAHDRPFITTNDLLDHTELGRTRANDRLNQLAADRRIEKTGVGAHAAVWWLSDKQERQHDGES